jgi:hypothetical protein
VFKDKSGCDAWSKIWRVGGNEQPVGFLSDTLIEIAWRFEFARVGHGRRVPLMMPRSISISSRGGFWLERVRKKEGRCEAKS